MKFNWFTIIIAICIGVLFGIMAWPLWIALILIITIGLFDIGRIIYTAFFSKNLLKITKYIDRYKRNPVYMYGHLLREGTDDQLIDVLEQIIKKYKQATYQASFGAQLYLLKDNINMARRVVEPAENSAIGQYTMALIDAITGNEQQALTYKVEKPWMQHSILANIAYAKGDIVTLEKEAALAVELAKGVQHYSNYYIFKRMIEKLKSGTA